MNMLKKMKKAAAFLAAAMLMTAAAASAEDITALSDQDLMTLYRQITEEVENRGIVPSVSIEDMDAETGAEQTAEECVAVFMHYWSANRVDDMVSLCSGAWRSQCEEPRRDLFAILANRTPISMEIGTIYGTDQDDTRTVQVRALIDRNNGKEPVWYLLQIRTVEEDGIWYIDPTSLMSIAAADIRAEEQTTPEPAASAAETVVYKYPYGVFLSVNENLEQFGDYETVVIDAQYFSGEEIESFRDRGHKVYTYLNIGSLEDFRDYYNEYKDLSLGAYEHWEEEVWVDVSQQKWQDLILKDIVPGLLEKGVDGFFVDNCDVYYVHPEEKILDGLTAIMKGLVQTGRKVIINGGDTFLDAFCEQKGTWDEVITGINQESVFSAILWDEEKFGTAEAEDREYFTSYVTRYGTLGAEIYLLEYTTDAELIREIDGFCKEHGYTYYVSDSVELDG